MKACQVSTHTPEYITYSDQEQLRPEDPYPGGPVLILVMSKVKGVQLHAEPGEREPMFLSREEMQSIRQQCLDTMEYVLNFLLSIFHTTKNREDICSKHLI